MGAKRCAFPLVARLGVSLSLLAAAPGCGEETGEGFAAEASELYNGTENGINSNGVVAVYMRTADSPSAPWYDHPCTGVVLNPSATDNYLVLTARHCVTAGGGTDNPVVLHPYGIKVSAALKPGKQPPANAADACEIRATPSPNNGYLGLAYTLDMAIVRVCAPIPSLSATATPLFAGSAGGLIGEGGVVAYGYGYTSDGDYGILRRSQGHVVDEGFSGGSTGYDYQDIHFTRGDNDTFTVNGDSGGPTYWLGRNGGLKTQIGVHSSYDNREAAVSRVTTQWIGSVLQRFYIRPQEAMTRALSRSGDQVGASVNAAATSGIAPADLHVRQWLLFDFPTRHIYAPLAYFPICLRRKSDNTLDMAACSTSTSQKWWPTADNMLQDGSETSCLKRSGTSSVVVAPCSTTDLSQKWYFDADSRVAGVY